MRLRKTFNFQLLTFRFPGGFTLIELLVVISIMVLLTAMSLPALSGYIKGARLRGAATEVASALRQARQLAITKRAERAVLLYFQGSTPIQNAVSIYANDTLSYKSLPKTINLKGSTDRVTFTARGSADSGPTFKVYDPLGNFRSITVYSATGLVTVSKVKK